MSWKYGSNRPGLTTATGTNHLAIVGAASEYGEIMEVNFGGESTTSVAQRTEVSRADEGTGAQTGLTEQAFSEQAPAATLAVGHTAATTDPAPEGAPLLEYGWNAHGGVIRWLAAPGEEIIMLGVSTVILENSLGVGQASYGLVWSEN